VRAILYSGNLRTFEYCAQNHADVLGECDVYFALSDEWGYIDRINGPWHSLMPNRREGKVTEGDVRKLTPSCFNIKEISIKPTFPLLHALKLKQNNNLIYQYLKMKECFDLLREEYDEIIRMRCDITIERVKFRKGLTCNKNIWYSQTKQNFVKKHVQQWMDKQMNEMVFTGGYKVMEKACRVFDNLDELNELLPKAKQYGESVFFHHLRLEGINPWLFNFKYRVKR